MWFNKIKFVFLSVLFGYTVFKATNIFKNLPPPKPDEPRWGPNTSNDTSIIRVRIAISEQMLIDLKQRLERYRPGVQSMESSASRYGVNSATISEVVHFWKTNYDWRKREKVLNEVPHFKTTVQGLDLHYVHIKPQNVENVRVIPLLLIHSWPGSIVDFYKIIPLLTKEQFKGLKFELIIPSVPGMAFSQAPIKTGMGATEVSVIFKNLMERLGYEKWYVHGSGFGSLIATRMAALYEDKIIGLHSTLCYVHTSSSMLKWLFGALYPPIIIDRARQDKLYPIDKTVARFLSTSSILYSQSSRPDALGAALSDSPVGLATYILDAFLVGTDEGFVNSIDGGLNKKYTYENLLDNIMIYWTNNCITSSLRIFADTFNKACWDKAIDRVAIRVPSACAKFYHDYYQPDSFLMERFLRLIQSTEFDEGGHFASLESPQLLANDILLAVDKIENLEQLNGKTSLRR